MAVGYSNFERGTELVFDYKRFLRRQPRLAHFVHTMRQTLLRDSHRMEMTTFGFRLAGAPALRSDTFEKEEIDTVSQLLPACDRFIDIGANIGLYACFARSRGIPVVAVEPLPANLRLLLSNLVENGWSDTEVVAAGLAPAPGISEMFGSDTGASLIRGWASLPENTLLREHIALTTLDAVIGDRFSGERLLIKVDVEGAELGLLEGGRKTLSRTPAPIWLMEICLHENFPEGSNPNYAATFETFFSLGYRVETANAARRPVSYGEVERWAATGRAESGSYNYLFRR